jgi:hypothetical protein
MKTINIEIPSGYVIDLEKSNLSEGKVVFKEVKKALPKTWEELGNIKGYYVGNDSIIIQGIYTPINHNKNLFATKELAEASIAMAQLSQLREVYRNGWTPEWNFFGKDRHCIEFFQDKIRRYSYHSNNTFFSFQSAEIRDEFLNNFASLIEIAKPLMS